MSEEELWELYDSLKDKTGFQRLQAVHTIAPNHLTYNSSHLKTFFQISGSGLEAALKRGDLWLLLILHTIFSVAYYSQSAKDQSKWPSISVTVLAIPGTVIAFVTVFYLNQTFSRYLTQFGNVIQINGTLHEFVLMLRVHLSDQSGPAAKQIRTSLWKLAVAVHFVGYGCLPWNREDRICEWVWWYLERNGILTQGQLAVLRPLQSVGSGNLPHKELLTWLERGVWAAQSNGYFVPHVGTNFTSRILILRTAIDALYTFLSGTIPFAYFTLLNFVTLLYLIILAYAFVTISKYWSILGFFLILVCYMGIMEIGNNMSNPLGNDKIDIPVFQEANKFFDASVRMMNGNISYPDEFLSLKPPSYQKSGENNTENNTELHEEKLKILV